MTRALATLTYLLAATIQSGVAQSPPPPAIAALGTCPLESGDSLPHCRVLYRTFGVLSPARDNVVLIPTWLGGRSADWIPLLGPKGLVDTTGFFVVVVDALGNGVSSSPSNSPTRPSEPVRVNNGETARANSLAG